MNKHVEQSLNALSGTLAIILGVVFFCFFINFVAKDIKESEEDIPPGSYVTVHGRQGIVLEGHSANIGISNDIYDVRIIDANPMYVKEFHKDEIAQTTKAKSKSLSD